MMTTEDDTGQCFMGLNGIMTKSFSPMQAAVVELCALVARQAAAILQLLNHLANPGGDAAPAAIAAAAQGGTPAPALPVHHLRRRAPRSPLPRWNSYPRRTPHMAT
jgi:hypothetical protein